MKLSEMNTRQMAKTLCSLTRPIANLCEDKAVMDALQLLQDMRSGKKHCTMAGLLAQVMPVLLDEHYDDVAVILAALTGKTRKEIDEQSGAQTVKDIKACLDGDLASFF